MILLLNLRYHMLTPFTRTGLSLSTHGYAFLTVSVIASAKDISPFKVSNGISWLDDIQQFYRERSAIEKDYSAKLSSLAKKYHEKKARKTGSLSVGDTPTLTPGSLER